MTELPPLPNDPASLKAWAEALGRDDLMALAQHITSGDLAAFAARANPEIDLPPPPDSPSLLTVTIELQESQPRIWRRLTLPGDLTLDAVHTLFQAAMGWTDSHLHRFSPGADDGYDQAYFITEFDEQEGEEGIREDTVRLDQVLCAPGDQMTYLYDFGDGWEHRVTLESTGPLTPENRQPSCVAGERACPPEDVGGIWSHHEVAAWLRAGAQADDLPDQFQDVEHAHGWLPEGYDPDAFDAEEATEAMRVWAAGEHLPWHGLPDPLVDLTHVPAGLGCGEHMAGRAGSAPAAGPGRRRCATGGTAMAVCAGGRRPRRETDHGWLLAAGHRRADRPGQRGERLVDRQGEPGGSHPAGRRHAGDRPGSGPVA